jgi:EmrB/QacA subfamily drug resistance transporter
MPQVKAAPSEEFATKLRTARPRGLSRYRSRRALLLTVFPSIMLPIFLAVIDQTIVATALPAIARSLGEVERLSWVVVSYLVANMIAAPVYGRLADTFGRRRLMLAALVLFVAASALCGVSASMPMLVGARVLQGFGGGGLMVLSQALVGESVPPRERGNYQGYIAMMIVSGSTFGPVAGGFLTQWFGWRSVFLINVPLGLLAMVLVRRLPGASAVRPARTAFDGLGVALLAAFVTPLLVALELLQRLDPATLPAMAGLTVTALIALFLLVRHELRTPAPLLPLAFMREPAIWRCDAMAAFSGASLVAMVTFLPVYLQVVDGAGPAETGFLMLPLTAGVGIGSFIVGRMISLTGRTAIIPSLALKVTFCTLVALAIFAPVLTRVQIVWMLGLAAFFQGSAMPVAQVIVQTVAGPRRLGVGAASVHLARSLGSAFGVAIVGAVLFAALAATDGEAASLFARMVREGPSAMAALAPGRQAVLQAEIGNAFRAVFLTVSVFSCCISALAWTVPLRRLVPEAAAASR